MMWDKRRQRRAKARGRVGGSMVTGGGRQENSLRTVRYNSEVLYTNTGWSVHSPLGLALYKRWVQSIHIWYKGDESAVCQSSKMCCALLRTESSSLHPMALGPQTDKGITGSSIHWGEAMENPLG